jgi:large subunit ribosomal protein L24
MKRIRKDDLVKITAGGHKGKIAKVTRVAGQQIYLENVNIRTRHVAANRLNPQGGKKDVQLPIDISNVALVVENVRNAEKTSKISYSEKDGKKTRVAKLNNKEVKNG